MLEALVNTPATPDAPRADSVVDDGFASLFEFLPIGAYRSSPDGRMQRANPELVRLNGYHSEAELLAAAKEGDHHWYVLPGRREAFRQQLARDGRISGFESEVVRLATGERIWVREQAHQVRDAAGRVRYFEGTVEEISAQVHARQALQRSQAQLQQIVELVPGVVYRAVLLPDGGRRMSFVSQAVRAVYGIEPELLMADGNALQRFRHPDDAARVEAEVRASVAANRPLSTELRIVRKDGATRWVHLITAPAPPENGLPVRIGVIFDITARKQAELALRENGELWQRALESTGDGVWDWHIRDGVELLSPKCKALYGFAPHELPDTPDALDDRTHPDDVARMRHDRDEHLAGRTPVYVNEHRVRHRDGRWLWVLSRGMVISRDARGLPLRMIGTHTDITGAKQAEALRLERDRAAAADQAKSQFLSRVSHELRTPLNAIMGFAQLLQLEPGDGERQQGWVGHVLDSSRHLLALMDDLLVLSSLQTGQLRVEPGAVALAPVLAEAWAMLAGEAARSGLHYVDEVAVLPPLWVQADRQRLKQVLSNLLSNAVKYNRAGGWVRVSARHDGEQLALAVTDSGPGLDAAQRARLFQPFERLGAQRGPVLGTGLGLALSRQLAEAMGGSIEVDSAPGSGSTFTLRLPAAEPARQLAV